VNTQPPSRCEAWRALAALAAQRGSLRIADLLAANPARKDRFAAQAAGVRYDFSRQRLDAQGLELLLQLARQRGLEEWRTAFLRGDPVNSTEKRAAGHVAQRAGDAASADVKATLERMRELAGRVRADGRIRRIVHLGTGGSALGPQLVSDALGVRGTAIEFRFAANVDPLDLTRALAGADPDSTLFIVVSKTFTTEETLANARAAKHWLGAREPARHFIAVTGNAAAASAFGASDVLPVPDTVGGRYSVWSAGGFGALCAVGADAFDELLAGAREIDRHFAQAPLESNVPVLMALVGVWNVNFLGAGAHAVLPYAHALALLPAYLQQLEMESNGKRVDREGRPVDYATAPVLWGQEGTVGQHSFYQLLHQGTPAIAADFIVAAQMEGDAERCALLGAYAEAQADALAFGTADPALEPFRACPGNRPSSTLTLERIDARNLGRLLALYEHKVFTQGVIWNLNSFDQWGVELGKQLARRILSRRKP
jgi:glucose-6-phosphate isomerase